MNSGVILQSFEQQIPRDGSLWRTIGERAASFAKMGISAVWMPPMCKCAAGGGSLGYDTYDLYDLGEFYQKGSVRTKYGTKEALLAAIAALHNAGVEAYANVVLNHLDEGDEEERLQVEEAIDEGDLQTFKPAREDSFSTRFTFPGRIPTYSRFVWNHTHFTGFDYPKPELVFSDRWREVPNSKRNRIFRVCGKNWPIDTEVFGGHWPVGERKPFFCFDIDHANPEVREELVRWGEWFLDTTHVDGLILDCVPHISTPFLCNWLSEMRRHSGRDFFAVGEYMSGDVSQLCSYLDHVGRNMSLLDYPLHYRFREASVNLKDGKDFDLRRLFSETLSAKCPENAVSFLDNQDTQFYAGATESPVLWTFQVAAYAFILLRASGRPCVFWRDLYGAPDNQAGIVRDLPLLLNIRQLCAKGDEVSIMDQGPHLIGFVRYGSAEDMTSGLVCLISNDKEGRLLPLQMPSHFCGRRFRCVIGDQKDVMIPGTGKAVFPVSSNRCAVFVPEEAVNILNVKLGTQSHPKEFQSMTSKLFDAVFRADTESVRQLLANGANPNERGMNGETPLMVAAREGYISIAGPLLDSGADATLEDDFGKSALVHAFLAEQEDAARLLLEHGARIDLNLVLHLACDWHWQTQPSAKEQPPKRGRPSKLINLPDIRAQLIAIAEKNDIHVARGTKFTRLEYRRFPSPQGDVVLSIDLHLPDPMPQTPPPLFVFIHGGSWTSGTTGDEPFWRVTKLGFAAASIEYRLTQVAAFPAPVKDCKAAICFLRTHAWEYGYDPDRICVFGNSAGGHLALLLGLTPDDPQLDHDAGDPNVSSSVQLVCSMSGPADPDAYIHLLRLLVGAAEEEDAAKRKKLARKMLKEPLVRELLSQKDSLVGGLKVVANLSLRLIESGNSLALRGLRILVERKIANDYFCGESPLDHQDILNAINPVWQAKRIAEMPPERREKVAKFFLAYGTNDPLVPMSGAADLSLTLDEAGVPNEFHELPGAGHDTSAMFPMAFKFLKDNL